MAKYRDVIRDATGEYVSGKHEGEWTAAHDEAREYETKEVALTALAERGRSTAHVLRR
jgi:hypothetical protein